MSGNYYLLAMPRKPPAAYSLADPHPIGLSRV